MFTMPLVTALANVGAAWQKFCEDKSVNITARNATEPFKKLRTKKRTNSNSNLLFVSWQKNFITKNAAGISSSRVLIFSVP
jgi:hypothetical protein